MENINGKSAKSVDDNPGINIDSQEKLNLILFSAGKLVSLLGTYIYTFTMSLYILKVTGSGTSFALNLLIGTLPRVILGPISGSIADRVDRKKMIVGLDFLSGAVVLGLLALSGIYGLQLPLIYAASFILSVISVFFGTAFGAAIPRLVRDQSLVKINSYNMAIESGAQILGPVAGGLVFGMVSMNLFLVVNGVSFILSAISEMFIDFQLNDPDEKEEAAAGKVTFRTIWQDIKEVLAFIKNHQLLSFIMPFSIAINFLVAVCFAVVLPYLINNTLGMDPSQYGMIEGAFSVGMLVAAVMIGRLPEKEKKRKSLVLGIGGMGIAAILLGIPGLSIVQRIDLHWIFVSYIFAMFLFAFLLIMVDMPLAVVLQRSIPNEMMGRVMGVLGTISSSLQPLGIIVAGISLDFLPAYAAFFVTGIYFIVSALIMYKSKAMQEY